MLGLLKTEIRNLLFTGSGSSLIRKQAANDKHL